MNRENTAVSMAIAIMLACMVGIAVLQNKETRSTYAGVDGRPAENGQAQVLYESEIPMVFQYESEIPLEPVDQGSGRIQRISISAVGDVIVHEGELRAAMSGEIYDFNTFFQDISHIIGASDFAIANLETTVAGQDKKYTGYPMFNSPDTLLDALSDAGFDLLITSNNHSMDRGEAGVISTIDNINKRGLFHTGTFKSQEDRDRPLVVNINGIKTAFLSYTYGTNGIPVKKPYLVNLIEMDKIYKDIDTIKRMGPDIIIAYIHYGDEYQRYPNSYQKKVTDDLFNAGVDIVLGTHAHVVQPMERKLIKDSNGRERQVFAIYSLGNFISDQRGDYKDRGLVVNLQFEKNFRDNFTQLKEVSLIPTWVHRYTKNGKRYYRVLAVNDAIKKYEDRKDNLLTSGEYEYIKSVFDDTIKHVESGIPKERVQR